MDNSKDQWVVNCKDAKHIVSLHYTKSFYADLYVDDKLIDSIKINHFLNYEYKFNVQEKECSIVMLVTDKSVGFVVDGEYQNKNRKYVPITKTPVLTWIALSIDLIVLSSFIICVFNTDLSLHNKMFVSMLFSIFALVLTYFIRVVSNSPCVIKNPMRNSMFRCLCIVIIEIAYILIAIGMINLFGIFN